MKMILPIAAAAAMMATAAGAQMTGPTDPSAPVNTNTMQSVPAADMAAPAPAPGSLVERDGKWWNGDREATKSELAEYKKMKKAGKPS